MNQKALREFAKWLGTSPAGVSPKNMVRFSLANKTMKNYVGTPRQVKNVQNRKKRARSIVNRRRYLINKKRRGEPLNQEEKHFLQYFNFAKNRGEAYLKSLVPLMRRSQVGRFSSNPLTGYEMFPLMKTVNRTRAGTYIVTPVVPSAFNVNRRTGRPTREAMKLLIHEPHHTLKSPVLKWKNAVSKIIKK